MCLGSLFSEFSDRRASLSIDRFQVRKLLLWNPIDRLEVVCLQTNGATDRRRSSGQCGTGISFSRHVGALQYAVPDLNKVTSIASPS